MVAPCLILFPRIRADAQLAEHANEMHRLGRRSIEDIVAIGQHLIAPRRLLAMALASVA